MKIKKVLLFVLFFVVLILELLPNGVVMRFANPEGEPWVRTYNYFSLMPFGYANSGPFLTAILTCILITLNLIGCFNQGKGFNVAVKICAVIATITSLMPWMYGVEYITTIGVVISVLLATTFAICFIKDKN